MLLHSFSTQRSLLATQLKKGSEPSRQFLTTNKVRRKKMTSLQILDLNKAFTKLAIPMTTKWFEYGMKGLDDEFTPLERTLIVRH